MSAKSPDRILLGDPSHCCAVVLRIIHVGAPFWKLNRTGRQRVYRRLLRMKGTAEEKALAEEKLLVLVRAIARQAARQDYVRAFEETRSAREAGGSD